MPEEATARPDIKMIRKLALGILFVLWLLSILFPPWEMYALTSEGVERFNKPAGYAWIFEPPYDRLPVRIDYVRLALEWLFLGSVAGAIFYLQRQKR